MRYSVHSIILFLLSTLSSFAQNYVSYSYDPAGNRDGRCQMAGNTMRGSIYSDSLQLVSIPQNADTLNIKTARALVSLDPKNLPLVLSEDEKSWLNDKYFSCQMAEEQAWWDKHGEQQHLRTIPRTRLAQSRYWKECHLPVHVHIIFPSPRQPASNWSLTSPSLIIAKEPKAGPVTAGTFKGYLASSS